MNLSQPAFDLFGQNEGRVLHRLAVLTEGASGRRIHNLSGVKSLRTTQSILERLDRIGLVTVRRVGAANQYTLNRGHILWKPISQVLESPASLEQHIAKVVSDVFGDRIVGAAVYGSFARGDADADSDIDILVVHADEPGTGDLVEPLDTASQRIRALAGNEAQLLPVSVNELNALVDSGDPLVESLRSDARSLTEGFDISGLLRRNVHS